MFKEFWKDPVWSKVIATAIIGTVTIIFTFLLDFWPTIGNKFCLLATYLQNSTSVANWVIGLLTLFSIPSLILIVALAWHYIRPSMPIVSTEKNWKLYVEDNFFGLRWRWNYLNNTISSFRTFCPHCDYQVYQKGTGLYGMPTIHFDCDCCHTRLATFEEGYPSLESKVARFIEQKIRKNTWQDNDKP